MGARVGVRQGCLVSPCLFNLFLEQIMSHALDTFEGTVALGGRKVNSLHFPDDIDLISGSANELADLTERIDRTSSAFGMEMSAEKGKVMTTSGTANSEPVTSRSMGFLSRGSIPLNTWEPI